MKVWPKEDLHKLAETDDVHISPFRKDGVTYALYVRAYNGQNSRWYQAAMRQKAGRIIAAGMTAPR